MKEKDVPQRWKESRVWQATRELQGSITILDPSILD